jgi:outer membrane protein assembly factor BamB
MTIDEGIVYVSYNEHVYAIELETGRENWRFPEEPERGVTFFAPPELTSDGKIIVGGYNNIVYALSPNGSQPRVDWTFDGSNGSIIGASTTVDGVVLVPSGDWNIYPLSVENGEPISDPFLAEEAFWSAPLVEGNMVYAASLDHKLYAFDTSRGRQAWSVDLGGAITDTPARADGILLAGTFARTVNAVDEDTGKVLWTIDTEGGVWGNPVIADGVAYFGDDAGMAYAVSLEDGGEIWREALEGPTRASPEVDDGVVYFVSEYGAVEALGAGDGRPVWSGSTLLEGRLLSNPQISSRGLLVPAMESTCLLYSIDPGDGRSGCLFSLE